MWLRNCWQVAAFTTASEGSVPMRAMLSRTVPANSSTSWGK